jgi:hypothetical protein
VAAFHVKHNRRIIGATLAWGNQQSSSADESRPLDPTPVSYPQSYPQRYPPGFPPLYPPLRQQAKPRMKPPPFLNIVLALLATRAARTLNREAPGVVTENLRTADHLTARFSEHFHHWASRQLDHMTFL